jgi:mannosyl-oligosaccharide alpha-1,2-mannosidase
MVGEVSLILERVPDSPNNLFLLFIYFFIWYLASIFDALDTMIIMGLENEYQRALEHIKTVDWTVSHDPSKTFETNIRYLGGLLAAYDLRPDPILLERAQELADKVIMPAFDTPNRMPAAYVDVAR